MTTSTRFQYDVLRALQFSYYVVGVPQVSDEQYDQMQRAYEEAAGSVLIWKSQKSDFPCIAENQITCGGEL